MKIVTYNIQHGVGRDGRFDLDRIADAIRDADIVALQEVTRNFPGNGGVDMMVGLTERLPDHFHAFGPGMDIDFGMRLKDGRPANRRFQFGNMLLSRWPITTVRNLLLPRHRTYDRANFQRAALEGLIETPLGFLRFYCTHLDHASEEERLAQIHHLKHRILSFPLEGGAITGATELGFPEPPCPEDFVLMGDFNMRPGHPDYEAMTGRPDSVYGARIAAHHPVDAFRLANGPEEAGDTWRDMTDPSRHARLDYCFVSAGLAARVTEVRIDAQAAGSDHQPVWVTLQ